MSSSDEGPIRFSGGSTPGGDFNGTLTWEIKNDGFLDIFVGIRLRLISSTGSILVEGSDRKRIIPGATESLSLSINVPSSLVDKIDSGELLLEIRTFFDLTGFSVSVPMLLPRG